MHDTSGPAFPQEEIVFLNVSGHSTEEAIALSETVKRNVSATTGGEKKIEPISEKRGGLTKREYYAARAIQALIRKFPEVADAAMQADALAEDAVKISEALIKALAADE